MIMSETTVIIEPGSIVEQDPTELNLRHETEQSHGNQVLKCLDAMRKERQLCDVILMVEGHELFAHRAVLSCHSNYFLEVFLTDEDQQMTKKPFYFPMENFSYLPLKLILQFIYQGSFRLTDELVPDVYSTAHQLRIETIVKACSIYLSKQLTEKNCLIIRQLAMDDDLREKATEFIQKNFNTILDTREFRAIPTIRLELIGSTIHPPKILFDLVLKWIIEQILLDHRTQQELEESMHLLYFNGEDLHDCAEMDDTNIHFSESIKDYKTCKLRKRNPSSNSSQPDRSLPIDSNHHGHSPETTILHISSSTGTSTSSLSSSSSSILEHNHIALAMINGKLTIISIHLSHSISNPSTPERNSSCSSTEKSPEDIQPAYFTEKDRSLARLLTPRCCFGTIVFNETIYIIGGYNRSDCLDNIEQYDLKENQWKSFQYPLTSRRGRVSATIFNDQIYVCGGSDGQKELNTAERLNLRSMTKWSMIRELSEPVAHSAMCSDEQFVYLIGGIEGDICKNECYRYNPNENSWAMLAPMEHERSQAGVVYFDGKIYVFGGSNFNRCLASSEIYTCSTNQWSNGPTMKECRRGCAVILYHEQIFIIGGSNGVTSLTSVEIFDPKTNEWLSHVNGHSNQLNIPRVGLGVAICDDYLYAIAGFDGRKFLKTIEVYDDQTQQWRLDYRRSK